ncbi:MAG: hypothetical protein GYA48_16965 [Chloroflexi bacterium]|nr:hypothetical protein [Chloroflexota bacterium]
MQEIINQTAYFSQPGGENTLRVFELAQQRAKALDIHTLLIATTTGKTAAQAARYFKDCQVIAVTHSAGFQNENLLELQPEHRDHILQAGGQILTCQHAFGGINRAIRYKLGSYQVDEVIAYTLRLFGQGMKVVVEIALMAADSGLVRTDQPVISIGGTCHGVDTAVALVPANAQNFFDLKILEVICLPSPHHPAFK